ncbi:hypothetical protein QWY90_10145 [Flavobacterium paronense]|uniref:DUF6660 family protein n=1 Tax=Flavobacterium paronense TaxID=1392775 RepID=A0ABV5GBJ6_9FLAO|nr:DUF6660 family protein [Flavobacterium paronense]MDN3677677.1 hypothetical protein [Flavobacterium paronense]
MKILTLILSFYLIGLSCMPCADGEAFSTSKKVAISNQSTPHHDNDVCSPMCVCSCCGCQGFSLNNTFSYSLISIKTIIDNKVPEYKSVFASNFFGSIWQPPQIA